MKALAPGMVEGLFYINIKKKMEVVDYDEEFGDKHLAILSFFSLTVAFQAHAKPVPPPPGDPPRRGAFAADRGNPLGVMMVKFKPGTGAARMREAITQSGGEVISDLSKINVIAAHGLSAGFVSRIGSHSDVAKVWNDRLSVTIPRLDVEDAGAGAAGKNTPQLGNPGPDSPPDPWHQANSFLRETNPEGILQWDDNRMNVPEAWKRTLGDGVVVAVLDTGVQGAHMEVLPNFDNRASRNMIPCNLLTRQFGPLGQMDCSNEDSMGHGTWVASRIAGAANGFASNGVAPLAQIISYKVLSTTLGGGLTSWITAAMIDACDKNVDIINMSLGGYDHPVLNADDYLLWVEAVDYCRNQGTAIISSAGNEHVRVNRVDLMVGDTFLRGVGQVAGGDDGYMSISPGAPDDHKEYYYLGGWLIIPAGVPGVIMVSATNNAVAEADESVLAEVRWPGVYSGSRDQLSYYSNYGSRIDIAAPGGARKYNIPFYDGGPGNFIYGGWGTFAALDASGVICTLPHLAALSYSACFKTRGQGFGWLQGTSMSTPNAVGVAALALAARRELRNDPDALLALLTRTARKDMANFTGPNDPKNFAPSHDGRECGTGFCHLAFGNPISFNDAYGAGMVDAGSATAP